jgi:hypothetical protein
MDDRPLLGERVPDEGGRVRGFLDEGTAFSIGGTLI